jgi:hypothetical protein
MQRRHANLTQSASLDSSVTPFDDPMPDSEEVEGP